MKFLLVTGQLARALVERYASESQVECEVFSMPAPVAALLTARSVAEALHKVPLEGFEAILTPGFIYGDVSLIERATGVPTFRGPRYAADLPIVLASYEKGALSKTVPACELLRDLLKERGEEELLAVEKSSNELLKRPGNVLIGSLPVGRSFPMRVLAEIVDAPQLSDRQIAKKARYYQRSGADMIDIGMIVGGGRDRDAARAVRAAKSAVRVPVSIDTIDPAEAEAGVEAGAELILSVDGGNAGEMSKFAREVAVVVIPANHAKGYFPKDPDERVEEMRRNLSTVKKLGMKQALADLIWDPIGSSGIVKSIVSFYKFARDEPEVPLFCGVGNVVELLDADSPGVNAVAAGIASELGVSVLLTTEASDKCRGSVGELSTASKMMFIAKTRGSPPTDLGLDLLLLKNRRFFEEPYSSSYVKGAKEAQPSLSLGYRIDPKGCLKIMIDRKNEKIVVIHYHMNRRDRPDFFIKGEAAQQIYRQVIGMNLLSDMDHSAYLGYELAKAEIALRTGKGYVQDSALF